jgi:hypothetical protein
MNVTENLNLENSPLDTAWETYSVAVSELAYTTFVEQVLPILQRRNWVLMQIQGDWRFGPGEDEDALLYGEVGWSSVLNGDGTDDDVITLTELMSSEIPGMPSVDLGTLMPSYGFPQCIVEFRC